MTSAPNAVAKANERRADRAARTAWLFGILCVLSAAAPRAQPPPWRADEVVGLEHFRGSEAARALLLQQGFVVDAGGTNPGSGADAEPLRQMFSAYVDPRLPPFVTVDLVLDAWTALYERVILAVERAQPPVLLAFSERLRVVAQSLPHRRADDLAALAGAALALQRGEERTADRAAGRVVADLRAGGSLAGLLRVHAGDLEPNGGYAAEPGLAGYFRARRLYQSCEPDVATPAGREFAVAFELALADAELRSLREELLAPCTDLVGPPVAGPLLPACRTPFFDLAQRLRPGDASTALVLLAAGPFASPAGRRIYADGRGGMLAGPACGDEGIATPFGMFLRDLVLLQQPDPRANAMFRCDAWADLQCGTQLAAWAQARHAVVLQARAISYMVIVDGSAGRVAPYPRAFAALGQRAEELAAHWRRLVLPQRDLTAAQDELRRGADHYATMLERKGRRVTREQEAAGIAAFELAAALLEDEIRARALDYPHLDEFVLGCARAACAAPPDTLPAGARAMLEGFVLGWPAVHLRDLARIASRLSALAERQLQASLPGRGDGPHGAVLDDDDRDFLRDLGPAVARLHGYRGNSWLRPNDDHARIATLGRPTPDRVLQVGVARPEPLYVILESAGRPTLHAGAVLSYRERRARDAHTDDQWRADVAARRAPAPPAFTRSFRR